MYRFFIVCIVFVLLNSCSDVINETNVTESIPDSVTIRVLTSIHYNYLGNKGIVDYTFKYDSSLKGFIRIDSSQNKANASVEPFKEILWFDLNGRISRKENNNFKKREGYTVAVTEYLWNDDKYKGCIKYAYSPLKESFVFERRGDYDFITYESIIQGKEVHDTSTGEIWAVIYYSDSSKSYSFVYNDDHLKSRITQNSYNDSVSTTAYKMEFNSDYVKYTPCPFSDYDTAFVKYDKMDYPIEIKRVYVDKISGSEPIYSVVLNGSDGQINESHSNLKDASKDIATYYIYDTLKVAGKDLLYTK